jgi:ABC-type nickel/cobalt efflux system permease component RcnA
MHNQKGEVVTGIMVVMMCVMMLFGGMQMMHKEHGSEEDHAQIEHKHNHNGDMQHRHDNVDAQAAAPDRADDK